MAKEVVMPQLGLSMDSGQIVEWLKKPGDPVQPGELLLVVESDKSAVEVEAVAAGRLQIVQGRRRPDPGWRRDCLRAGRRRGPAWCPRRRTPRCRAAQPRPSHPRPAGRCGSGPACRPSAIHPRRAAPGARAWPGSGAWRLPPACAARLRSARCRLLSEQHAATGGLPARRAVSPHPAGLESQAAFTPLARRLAENLGLDLAALAHASIPASVWIATAVEQAARRSSPG